MPDFLISPIQVTRHEGADDLLSAGLSLDELRALPSVPTDVAALDAAALRRRAIHANWRGIADLAPGGGFGSLYGSLQPVPGREYSAFARVPGASQPHRVLAQIPDAFDRKKRCLVVAAVSGSRGIYGAISVSGGWALPRGCAVVYTDKGAGTGVFDVDSGTGVALDGTRAAAGSAQLEFEPKDVKARANEVLFKHAHSGDNPEADWGRHVVQAAAFGLHALNQAYPALAPFTPENTRIIATGISNGGGAVLRAAELPEGMWFDAVVAGEPNITVEGVRPIYDVATEAGLLQSCAMLDPRIAQLAAWPAPPAALAPVAAARCASLAHAGILPAGDTVTQAAAAYDQLVAGGWTPAALAMAPTNIAFDMWRAVGATYASAYARAGSARTPCGHSFAVVDTTLLPRSTTAVERALWWSDGSGVAPTTGIAVLDPSMILPDPMFAGLRCLREAWIGDSGFAKAVQAGVAATRASAKLNARIVAVVHGIDDGLIPVSFTSQPWFDRAQSLNPDTTLRLYRIQHAQHFDAFLGLPVYATRYVPLIPYVWRALDAAWAQITEGKVLPPSGEVITTTREAHADGTVDALQEKHLGTL